MAHQVFEPAPHCYLRMRENYKVFQNNFTDNIDQEIKLKTCLVFFLLC